MGNPGFLTSGILWEPVIWTCWIMKHVSIKNNIFISNNISMDFFWWKLWHKCSFYYTRKWVILSSSQLKFDNCLCMSLGIHNYEKFQFIWTSAIEWKIDHTILILPIEQAKWKIIKIKDTSKKPLSLFLIQNTEIICFI